MSWNKSFKMDAFQYYANVLVKCPRIINGFLNVGKKRRRNLIRDGDWGRIWGFLARNGSGCGMNGKFNNKKLRFSNIQVVKGVTSSIFLNKLL